MSTKPSSFFIHAKCLLQPTNVFVWSLLALQMQSVHDW